MPGLSPNRVHGPRTLVFLACAPLFPSGIAGFACVRERFLDFFIGPAIFLRHFRRHLATSGSPLAANSLLSLPCIFSFHELLGQSLQFFLPRTFFFSPYLSAAKQMKRYHPLVLRTSNFFVRSFFLGRSKWRVMREIFCHPEAPRTSFFVHIEASAGFFCFFPPPPCSHTRGRASPAFPILACCRTLSPLWIPAVSLSDPSDFCLEPPDYLTRRSLPPRPRTKATPSSPSVFFGWLAA